MKKNSISHTIAWCVTYLIISSFISEIYVYSYLSYLESHIKATQEYVVPSQAIWSKEKVLQVKNVPTLRVFKSGNILLELEGFSPLDLRTKVQQFIDAEMLGLCVDTLSEHENVFSASTYLDDFRKIEIIPANALLVCKYEASWCRKCSILRKPFENLARNYRNKPIFFLNVNVDAFSPNRLEEKVQKENEQPPKQREKFCSTCNSTGFLDCPECLAKGHILKESNSFKIAEICPRCVGYKKVRCHTCGGKCLMCS